MHVTYGVWTTQVDVTQKFKELFVDANGNVNVVGGRFNYHFGDPTPNRHKQLFLFGDNGTLCHTIDEYVVEEYVPSETFRSVVTPSGARILVALFGVVPRSIKTTWPSIRDHIITPLRTAGYEVDLYGFDLKTDVIDGCTLDPEDVHIVPWDHFEQESQSTFDAQNPYTDIAFWSGGPNEVRQMYSESRVGAFLAKHKDRYASAVVCGSDFWIQSDIVLADVDRSVRAHTVYTLGSNDMARGMSHLKGYTNGFYIGQPSAIVHILSRYDMVRDLWHANMDYEVMLAAAFDRTHTTRMVTNLSQCKIRANGIMAYQNGLF